MSQLIPNVQSIMQDENVVQLKARIGAELLAFKGHFPDVSVFPGVAQISIIQQVVIQYFASLGRICRIEQLRFQSFILPDQEIFIVVEKIDDMISFKITDAMQAAIASGRLFFKS